MLILGGSNTPLSREEKELFSAITVGNIDKVHEILNAGKVSEKYIFVLFYKLHIYFIYFGVT